VLKRDLKTPSLRRDRNGDHQMRELAAKAAILAILPTMTLPSVMNLKIWSSTCIRPSLVQGGPKTPRSEATVCAVTTGDVAQLAATTFVAPHLFCCRFERSEGKEKL